METQEANHKAQTDSALSCIGGGNTQLSRLTLRSCAVALWRLSLSFPAVAAAFLVSLCVLASCAAEEADAPHDEPSDYALK